MAYIGTIPAEAYTSFAVQHFTTSATDTFTLDFPVANENEIALFINNVRQEPGSSYAYTASGTTLTLSSAITGSDSMYCVFIGKAVQTVTPAVGSVTNDMLAGSIATSKLANQNIGFRNLIINGDMSIAQRGTSASSITSSGYHTVDRWRPTISSLGTWTISQSTDVPTGQGFGYSQKFDCTTADASPSAGDLFQLNQRIEGQMLQMLKKGTSNAESTTLSFWVKSNKTGTYIVGLADVDNSRNIFKSYTINSASTWEKKTLTFAGDTTGTFGNDNARSLDVRWWLGAGSTYTSGTLATSWESETNANTAVGQVNLADNTSNEWYITGVQLEVGTSASDFEFLPYDVNFRRCQRYHFRHNPSKDSQTTIVMGIANGGSDMNSVLIPVPVQMRANPSLSTDPGSGSVAIRWWKTTGNTGTISSYSTLASQGDGPSDGSGFLALTINGFGGNLVASAPNGIEFESTDLILDSEL